jgi:hypothetical protein
MVDVLAHVDVVPDHEYDCLALLEVMQADTVRDYGNISRLPSLPIKARKEPLEPLFYCARHFHPRRSVKGRKLQASRPLHIPSPARAGRRSYT